MTVVPTILVCAVLAAALAAAAWLCARILRQTPAGSGRAPAAALLWTAFLGVWLYFILESGLSRRIAPDLFLPVQAGVPLPWRALRMGLCLDLALAAGVWGGGARAKLQKLMERDAGCWLAAAAVTAVFFLWTWRVTVYTFMTNDDTYILRSVGSDAFWKIPVAFTHHSLCAALNWLYRCAPDVHWYTGYHLAVQAVSMAVIGRCLYMRLRRRRWPVTARLLLHWLLGMGVVLYTLSELSFTVTPALAGTAAVALVLCRDETGTAGRIASDLGSAVLAALCWLQRADTWTALCCFWLLAAAYQLLRTVVTKPPRRLGRMSTLLVSFGLILALQAAAGLVRQPAQEQAAGQAPPSQSEATPEPTPVETAPAEEAPAEEAPAEEVPVEEAPAEEAPAEEAPAEQLSIEQAAAERGMTVEEFEIGYSYNLSEYYRSQVMDYLVATLTDEELEEMGLPPELSTLLRGWFFMDPRINTHTFRLITGAYSPSEQEGVSLVQMVADLLLHLPEKLEKATINMLPARRVTAVLMTAALALLLALVLLRLVRYGLSGWMETLCGLCAAGGAAVLLLYLIMQGRMLIRVFLVPAIPAAVTMLLMLAGAPEKPAVSRLQKTGAALSGAVAVCLGVLCLFIARSVPYAGEAVDRRTVFADQTVSESYANANPDLFFITNSLDNDIDPFHDPWSYPENLTRWGGTGVTATTDRLYADAFFRDNVLFLCEKSSTVVALLQYLTLEWGPVQAQVVAQPTNDISVMDISQIVPEPGYTGWYEYNGLTYYFADGQALTGTQTVDGQEYTFAPAGADAQFAAAPGQEGILYYTDAYSLVDQGAQTS